MMVSVAQTARRAVIADVPALARMLAAAYHDDPVAVWACRSDALRAAMLQGLYQTRLLQALPQREVWAAAELTSAAVWLPPQGAKTTLTQELARVRCFFDPRLMARLPMLALGAAAMRRRHPRTPPHWYLSLLGTAPAARGQGLGSAVLRPVLERCDAEAVGIYLESSKERNIDFYARHGFHVTEEWRLPRGPRMWSMWREPPSRR
jgi:ribosomal protein S18 acetylase RimI-like enzyme